jgi:A/G-specific adenine glycosylase
MDKKLFFRENLLAWFAQSDRPMPWKGERDPYKIWLSEVILQQTRVEQGRPYFLRFVEAYPTVQDLAAAPQDEVLKLWEGLGYYTRAHNLHATAQHVAGALDGRFPATYDEIRALRGVGDYTAAAIASFAYDLPHAVVDGNVFRVLARFFAIDLPTDAPAARRAFAALAQELLDPARPAAYNQAIMDFGATHCTPVGPKCGSCPLAPQCAALAQGRVGELPVRAKAPAKKARYFLYAVFNTSAGDVAVRQRRGRDIWQGLYDFPLVEVETMPPDGQAVAARVVEAFFPGGMPEKATVSGVSSLFRQTLSHQVVAAVFVEIQLPEADFARFLAENAAAAWQRMPRYDVKKNIAVPRLVDQYFGDKLLTLNL